MPRPERASAARPLPRRPRRTGTDGPSGRPRRCSARHRRRGSEAKRRSRHASGRGTIRLTDVVGSEDSPFVGKPRALDRGGRPARDRLRLRDVERCGQPSPEPHDLPVRIVGSPQLTGRVDGQLDGTAPGAFKVLSYSSPGAARKAILHGEVYGAFVPRRPSSLLVASAASLPAEDVLRQTFEAAARAQGQALVVHDIAPLPRSDSGGATSFSAILSLTFQAPAHFASRVSLTISAREEARRGVGWRRARIADTGVLLLYYRSRRCGGFRPSSRCLGGVSVLHQRRRQRGPDPRHGEGGGRRRLLGLRCPGVGRVQRAPAEVRPRLLGNGTPSRPRRGGTGSQAQAPPGGRQDVRACPAPIAASSGQLCVTRLGGG